MTASPSQPARTVPSARPAESAEAELPDPQALWVKWQILGRYQDGYPIIAEFEVR